MTQCPTCQGEGLTRTHGPGVTATGLCLACHGTGRTTHQHTYTPTAIAFLREHDITRNNARVTP